MKPIKFFAGGKLLFTSRPANRAEAASILRSLKDFAASAPIPPNAARWAKIKARHAERFNPQP